MSDIVKYERARKRIKEGQSTLSDAVTVARGYPGPPVEPVVFSSQLPVEEDGDEIFTHSMYCSKCRVGFSHEGKPLYAVLFANDRGFLECSVCGGCYGKT